MKPTRALIFDLDGVLIDTEPLHKKAKRLAFAEFGLAVPEALYDAFRGRSDQDMAMEMVRAYGSEGVAWEEVLARKHALFESLEHEIGPVPGALAFLERAKGNIRSRRPGSGGGESVATGAGKPALQSLGLCTSATERNQRYAFDRFGLAPFFDIVVHAGMLSRTKPDPEPYLLAAAKLGIPAGECLVIEDSRNGILSARAAGCRVAAIATSFTRAELAEAEADWVAGGFAELGVLLDI
jgi:beta-phosphoglucomutase-like phosphatase (HAD superfamily)